MNKQNSREDLKEGIYGFLNNLIKLKSFVKTDKCTYATANVKLIINSICTKLILH